MPRRLARAAAALLALAALPSCATYSERLAEFRVRYGAGDFHGAEAAIDEVLEDEADAPEDLLAEPQALAAHGDVADGNGVLFLLEKGMTRLALRDPDGCIDLLRRARDELDRRFQDDVLSSLTSTLTDDAARSYPGADYEHVLARAMLAIADLVTGGQDAFAYALQINETQEKILGSEFGAAAGYAPREQYRRVAIGAYLEGVIHEEKGRPGEAARAYRRAMEYAGESPLLENAIARTTTGRHAPEGYGVVHVLGLVGRGPYLIEGVHPPTDLASRLAGVLIVLLERRGSGLFQAPVKVPVVAITDPNPVRVRVQTSLTTPIDAMPLLDVNEVAREQLEANMPWIVARALVRRGLKAFASVIAEMQIDERQSHGVAFLTAAMLNYVATLTERADTRNWTSLPAQFQVGRLELPAGDHDLLVEDQTVRVRVSPGHASFLVWVRPSRAAQGVALVDRWSTP